MTSHPRPNERSVLPPVQGLSLKREWDPADVDRLARRAAEGDEDAFAALVRIVFRRIYRWALVRVGDADDAADVSQRVLMRLHARLGSWEGRGRFTTWLYRMTANEASSWSRRAARQASWLLPFSRLETERAGSMSPPPPESPEHSAPTGLPDLDQERLINLVQALFTDLPARQRQVLDLVDFQGFSPSETAEMLQMNSNTVRANLLKARRSLRRRILEERPDALELLP